MTIITDLISIFIMGMVIYSITFWGLINWNTPMNGFQDWLKLNDSYYIKDTILVENELGGVDEIWHNNIWFTEDGYSLTTKQLYAEYLRYAKNDPRFSKHFQ